MSTVVLMIGMAGSGKTSYISAVISRYNPNTVVIISTDQLRGMYGKSEDDQSVSRIAFAAAYSTLEENLRKDTDLIIIDAMNLNKKSRKKFLNIVRRYPNSTAVAVCMMTPVDECIRRNSKRDRVVPPDIIMNQATRLSMPIDDGGEFEYVFYIKPNKIKF